MKVIAIVAVTLTTGGGSVTRTATRAQVPGEVRQVAAWTRAVAVVVVSMTAAQLRIAVDSSVVTVAPGETIGHCRASGASSLATAVAALASIPSAHLGAGRTRVGAGSRLFGEAAQRASNAR